MSSHPATGAVHRRHTPTQGARIVPVTMIPPSKASRTRSQSASAPSGARLSAAVAGASASRSSGARCFSRAVPEERRSRATWTTNGPTATAGLLGSVLVEEAFTVCLFGVGRRGRRGTLPLGRRGDRLELLAARADRLHGPVEDDLHPGQSL